MNIPNEKPKSVLEKGKQVFQNFQSFWKNIDKSKAGLWLTFIIPVTIMLSLFIIKRIFPFGEKSFLFSDMYHQYTPFFSEFIRKIKGGEGLSYSWNVGIGSNFLALYVYYLASPLHWLAFLFPEKYLIEFMSYLVIIKIGLCGLTSAVYLREHFHTKDNGILLFSCVYALSGFMAAYNWNIMWLDCVVLLPLILMGLERLVKEGRCTLYCLTLALSILTNYYISIMICIFLVLYFLVLLLSEKRSVKILWNFALYSLLAGGIAAILLVPEVLAILETDFGDMDFPKKLESYFSVFDMLARHCVSVTTERALEHWPNIYCGAAVFLLLPMYVINPKISLRKRFGYMALAGFMLVSFSTNVLDFIWHGMNYPDSLPARQSFCYILLILIMCYEAYYKADAIEEKQILYGYLAAVIFLLGCEKFVDNSDFSVGIELVTLGFVTAYAVLLYLRCTRKELVYQSVTAIIAFGLVVLEVSLNTYNTSIGTITRDPYVNQQEDYKAMVELSKDLEGEDFYRIEKFTRKTKNDGTLTGYPTASVFSSTMNSHVADLYKRLGMRHSKVYYGFDGATAFTSALLNVKYMFGEDSQEEGLLYKLEGYSGDIYLYDCNFALPFGYTAPTDYDLPEGYANEGLKLQNQMIKKLGISGELFHQADSSQSGDNVKLKAEEEGYYYMIVTASGTKKIDASGSCTRKFSDLKNGSVLYLGWLSQGDEVTLKNGDKDDSSQKISLSAYKMDLEVLKQALEVLSQDYLKEVSYNTNTTYVSGEIDMETDKRLILSIPYEKGWTVLVDGEKIVPQLFGETFIALDLTAGHHSISMHYVPKGKYAGILLSLCSITIFVIIMGINWRKKRKQEKEIG